MCAMRIAEELYLCADCRIVATNDDPTGIDSDERVSEVYAGLAKLGPDLCNAEGGTDTCGDPLETLELSTLGCDSCGCRLAQDLYPFVVLESVAYSVTLDASEIAALEWIGDRYGFAQSLLDVAQKTREATHIGMTEPEAWEWREAVDSDMEGGHSPFPCMAEAFASKLWDLYASIV